MKPGGGGSWRVDIGNEQVAHALLYVRDACQLIPADDPIVPPRLADQVPDRSSMMAFGHRAAAAEDWLDWWTRLVRFEGSRFWENMLDLNVSESNVPDAVAAHLRGVGSLDHGNKADEPSLQVVASTMAGEALSWASRSRRPIERQRRHAHWHVGRAVAEEIIDAYQVSPDRVRAGVTVLAVDGAWGHVSEPGVLLCSETAFEDEALFARLLREAFETGLARRPL